MSSPTVLNSDVYKATINPVIVVKRYCELNSLAFRTFHDKETNPSNYRNFILHGNCSVEPRASSAIVASVKTIRPQHTWAISVLGSSGLESIDLYGFSVAWPASWAPRGYSTFEFGFPTREEAVTWHEKISECITALRSGDKPIATISQAMSKVAPMTDPTPSNEAMATPNAVPQALNEKEPENNKEEDSDDDDDDDDEEEEEEEEEEEGLCLWTPYKHINGVAVYRQLVRDESNALCEEFMVSQPIRSTPKRCLKFLVGGQDKKKKGKAESLAHSILGPASQVVPLSSSSSSTATVPLIGASSDVMSIVLEAGGVAGALCAPREAVVERVVKPDPHGTHLTILFSSLAASKLNSGAGGGGGGGALHEALEAARTAWREREAEIEGSRRAQGAAERPGLFRTPVPCKVDGSYTICPMKGRTLENSAESLVTLVLRVDLGGSLGSQGGWKKRLFSPVMKTLSDAFLARMLMSIVLMRDELSYARFSHRPFEAFAGERGPSALSAADRTSQGAQVSAASASVINAAHVIGSLSRSLSTRRPLSNDPGSPMDKAPSFSARSKTSGPRSAASAAFGSSHLASVAEDAFDTSKMAELSLTDPKFWSDHRIHCPGGEGAPFKVRGPSYLKDKKKVEAGDSVFALGSVDLVSVGATAVDHVSRFLPSVRSSGLPYAIVINLVVPGSPCLSLAATFVAPIKPEKLSQTPPSDPMSGSHDWTPFDFVLHKFVNGSKEVRDKMLKLIPNIADGSWIIKSSVGNTPVILGKALKTIYAQTDKYLEVTIDISANKVANYVTGQVRSCTKSLIVDMGFVLEGTEVWELPECLLGTMRMYRLDLSGLKTLDMSKELPLV